ncbi:unnamed protein product, partial [Iphiclides podalirius]
MRKHAASPATPDRFDVTTQRDNSLTARTNSRYPKRDGPNFNHCRLTNGDGNRQTIYEIGAARRGGRSRRERPMKPNGVDDRDGERAPLALPSSFTAESAHRGGALRVGAGRREGEGGAPSPTPYTARPNRTLSNGSGRANFDLKPTPQAPRDAAPAAREGGRYELPASRRERETAAALLSRELITSECEWQVTRRGCN